METFPVDFPAPNTSLLVNGSPNSVRTQMDSGLVRQRRRFTVEQVQVRVQWTMGDTELAVFVAWHKFKIGLGNDWFIMNLPLGGEVQPHVVRFLDGKFDHQYVPVSYWDVSAILEIQERVTYDEDTLAFYLDLGFTPGAIANLYAFTDEFHIFLHDTYPPLTTI